MTFVLGALLAALRLLPVAALAAPPADAVDFGAQARLLHRVAACGGDAALPAAVDARAVAAHCKAVARDVEGYRKKWLATALPVLARLVPAGIPDRVVYPFGGGDLLTALATFPKAQELTVLSLETAGDVRAIGTLRGGQLRTVLDLNRKNIIHLFHVAHSKTTNLMLVMRGELPGQLIFAMVALVVHGYEPVSLRYFRLEADGAIHYLTADDIAAGAAAARKSKAARAKIFANVELGIRPVGGGPITVYRHISANLDDNHLKKDPSPIKHLEAKGRVAAMTKAASYLLWWGEFSTIRNYLLGHVDWMISDSTGIPPRYATPAGFEYETYGRFSGPFLPAGREWTSDFKKLWRSQPARELPFRYGYPDIAGHHHMMITRRVEKK